MNDPGLHESTQEAAQDVEKNGEDELAEQEEQEFLDPRYVFEEKGGVGVGAHNNGVVFGGSRPQRVP
jgi:hypothetical protein